MTQALSHLKTVLDSYHPLSQSAWHAYKACTRFKYLKKGEILCSQGTLPTHFAFLHKGLMRAYLTDEDGNEFNKNFFCDGRFPGAMSALLDSKPSFLTLEALEECEVLEIDFKRFRTALFEFPDLMALHIHYLEKHWLLEKEPKEIGYLQYDAKERYLIFLDEFHQMAPRLPQYHIASYLGVTATQLSRIRKELN